MKVLIELPNGPEVRYQASDAVEIDGIALHEVSTVLNLIAAGGMSLVDDRFIRAELNEVASALRKLHNREVGAIVRGR